MNEVLLFLQENWQWMFALVCVGLYFRGKKNNENNEPENKLEEIGQKAEAIIEAKAEEFVEQVEEEALEALEEKLDSLDEQAMEVIKEAIELATEVVEKSSEPDPSIVVTEANGYPNPQNVSRGRQCPCGSEKLYRLCHAPMWKPAEL